MLRFWKRFRQGRSDPPPQAGLFAPVLRFERATYIKAVAVVAAKLAKADGPVQRAEIDCFKHLFPLAPHERDEVAPLFDLARESAEGFQPFAVQLVQMLGEDPSATQALFDRFHRIALADGSLTGAEGDYLGALARVLRIEDHWEAVQAARSRQEGDPYAVLGVGRDVSDQELRSAWHRLIRRYHPDAAAARGESGSDHTRVATINAAYRRIVRARRRNVSA